MTEKTEIMNFELTFQQLQNIITRLESADLPLEEALTLYEQGQKLADQCAQILEKAQQRVEMLNPAKLTAEED
ncbi:MAG TPA: exodeoxyribonuclease VII small subunit [Anaerolineaceae bacterium]|nr:exodeoxyribonuclease VII small subunit [Anaerolineaceae bacterium]